MASSNSLRRFALFVLTMLTSVVSHAGCRGSIFNPVTDVNFMYMYPITLAGVSVGAGSNPPTIVRTPQCVCPSHIYGGPMVGVLNSYWEPIYLAEVAQEGGCLSTIGAKNVMPAYKVLSSAADTTNDREKMQVHWYKYPLFSIIGMMLDFMCTSFDSFSVGYVTEVDPTHQSDVWATVLAPESVLFANPVATLACVPDAVSAQFGFPLDPLFWCIGAQGTLYPFSGSSTAFNTPQKGNTSILYKFMGKQHRMGGLFQTVGPSATCAAHPNPVLVKSQYRIDPVAPIPYRGPPVYIGGLDSVWAEMPPLNYPAGEYSAYMIWVAKQCCVRL